MNLTPEQQAVWFYTAFPAVAGTAFPEADAAIYAWMREFKAKSGRERAEMLSGMRQGINDTLAGARHSRPEEIAHAERVLAQKGLPSLRKMAAVLGRKHVGVLKRGAIKNDEEFYVVAEILSDVDFEISSSERKKLGELSRAYETRAR